jgi:hypothetical protein
MKHNLTALCVMSLALATAGGAQTTASSSNSGTGYTQAQLKQLVKDANTSSQYQALSVYYDNQEKKYLAQATEEKQEWERRSANVMLTAAKYPRPVDSSHYLYDYYTYKAEKTGKLAAKYVQLAASAASAGAKQ